MYLNNGLFEGLPLQSILGRLVHGSPCQPNCTCRHLHTWMRSSISNSFTMLNHQTHVVTYWWPCSVKGLHCNQKPLARLTKHILGEWGGRMKE